MTNIIANLGKFAKRKYSVRSTTATYRRWAAMHHRVKHSPNYKHILIDPRWISFQVFVDDMGECPDDYSLDRKNNNSGYNPDNCHFIPKPDQNRNRRSCIMVNGITLKEYSSLHNIAYGTLYYRVTKMNLTPKEAVQWHLKKA